MGKNGCDDKIEKSSSPGRSVDEVISQESQFGDP
jgi:hypothetical protein